MPRNYDGRRNLKNPTFELDVLLGDPHDTLRRNVMRLRSHYGMGRRALSLDIKVGEDCIRDLESGRKGATLDLACKIAAYFGVTLDDLVHPTTLKKALRKKQ